MQLRLLVHGVDVSACAEEHAKCASVCEGVVCMSHLLMTFVSASRSARCAWQSWGERGRLAELKLPLNAWSPA